MMFVVRNPDNFHVNALIQSIGMRPKNPLHLPLVKFSSIQNCITYSSIKIFNNLPLNISKFHRDSITFKSEFRKFLVKKAFYSIYGFISINCDVN